MTTEGTAEGRRPRLRDIAERVGISEAAASFALNGKPGVSEATRRRVREVAEELKWSPHQAARALSGAGASTVGLVIARSMQDVGSELFFHRLMSGMQAVLSRRHYGLLLQAVDSVQEELETYRRWKSEQRVDGVVLVDLRRDDPRPAALVELGLPALIAGGPDPLGLVPSVSIDDAAAMTAIVRHLRDMGHERIAYLSGPPSMLHVHRRIEAFERAGGELSLGHCRVESTDFSAAAGSSVTEAVLRARPRPTAVIYDNEVLAVAGVGAVRRLSLRIPADVAVVVWEDTPVCTALQPELTALQRDAAGFGADVAERLLRLLAGAPVADYAERVPSLLARASTLGVLAHTEPR
ncbi:LacI family DNA-binding transcriptional regulator [Streptomyces sp. NPDC007861]|uniref:LacI family DNA-binding transcriptional regulator n=1 Tax=Streptomyces sp. NPDC007861 TaxID=3154893 RepID=UPI0033C5F5D5